MERSPVSLREALKEFADFEVIARHNAHQGDQFFADVFGDRLLVHLEGQVVAALGGIFVQ